MDRDIREINSEFIRLNEAELLTPQAKRKEKGDYTVRYGITKEPCFKQIDATKMMPPLHYWITQLDHIEQFAYHINTPEEKFKNKKRVMGRGKPKGDATEYIEEVAKKAFIKEAKENPNIGLLLDSPSGSGHGGGHSQPCGHSDRSGKGEILGHRNIFWTFYCLVRNHIT